MITTALKSMNPLRISISFLIVGLTAAVFGAAYASPTYLSQYNTTYGAGATCSFCHSSGSALNSTGTSFLNSGRNLAAIGPSNLSPGGSPPATTPTNPPRTSAPNASATQSGPSFTTKQAPTTSATTQPAPGNLQKNAVAPNIPSNNAEANSTSENNRSLRNPTGKNGTDSSDVKRAASGTSKKEDGDSKRNRETRTSSSRDRE